MNIVNLVGRRVVAMLFGLLLILGTQKPAQADPYLGGYSSCWSDGIWVMMSAVTWIDGGWFPEVQVIGHINTITQLHAPYLQVFGPYMSVNTIYGTATVSPIFYASAIPGWYAIETLHGYIDEDETVHEAGITGWACYL